MYYAIKWRIEISFHRVLSSFFLRNSSNLNAISIEALYVNLTNDCTMIEKNYKSLIMKKKKNATHKLNLVNLIPK